jgi:hypothetical protein
VGSANRCSEECFLKVRAGALVVSLWPKKFRNDFYRRKNPTPKIRLKNGIFKIDPNI